VVNNVGGVLHDLGKLGAARAAHERALGIDEAAYGPHHPHVAIRVNNLGRVLRALGELAAARAAFERALRILEASLPADHPNIRTARRNLAALDEADSG
jgi:tetratricopeptide (TPR) repeat protein